MDRIEVRHVDLGAKLKAGTLGRRADRPPATEYRVGVRALHPDATTNWTATMTYAEACAHRDHVTTHHTTGAAAWIERYDAEADTWTWVAVPADQTFELNGVTYGTDRETMGVMRSVVSAYYEGGSIDASAVSAVMHLGIAAGRIAKV